MPDRPAKPPVHLQYLMWDGTKPVDSIALARGLERSFRCINLLDDSPKTEFGIIGKPRIFQPCGADGNTRNLDLWLGGMFLLPQFFFSPLHSNKGDDLPNILQFSGHGMPGFMFAESWVPIARSQPIAVQPGSFPGNLVWKFVDIRWDNPSTKVVIFSACRQLAGRFQQFQWSLAMRGATNRVHVILSYKNTAPAADTSAAINRSFLANLQAGQSFLKAWQTAHGGGNLRSRWAALAYRSCVDDQMDKWVKTGLLPIEPDADEDILYFDEQNSKGRVVKAPSPAFEMSMTFLGATKPTTPTMSTGNLVAPWSILSNGTVVRVDIKFLTDTFQDGDVLWLGALQVRPDYAGPFEIETLFTFVGHETLMKNGEFVPLGRLHDASGGWEPDIYTDLYEIEIKKATMKIATFDAASKVMTLQMIIGSRPNDHLPAFYFMVRIGRGNREFGIPTIIDKKTTLRLADQVNMVDEPHFCHFVLLQ